MSGRLPHEHGVGLIRRLASDDAFRERFETDPATAMAELGISAQVIDALEIKCLLARRLAPKQAFAKLLDDIGGAAMEAAMDMQVPQAALVSRRQQAWPTTAGAPARPAFPPA